MIEMKAGVVQMEVDVVHEIVGVVLMGVVMIPKKVGVV